MKKAKIVFILTVISILATVISCSKTDSGSSPLPSTPANEATLLATLSQNASDQSSIQNDEDLIEGDVQKAVAIASNFDGTLPNPSFPLNITAISGATIDMGALTATNKQLTIYYQNATSNGITKSGHIVIQLIKGKIWSDPSAVLLETLDSLKITFNGFSRVYQSTRYITNILGGLTYKVNSNYPFTYTFHSYGTVTFEDNSVSTFWITRRNTFKNTSDTSTLPTIFNSNGDSTINGNLFTMGGLSRFKTAFKVMDSQTYAASLYCGYKKPYLGIRSFIAGDTVKITFGVNANGNQTGASSTPCDSLYGYKLEWTKLSGQLGSKIIGY